MTLPHEIPIHPVETRYRRIAGPLHSPRDQELLREALRYEPYALTGQPPVVWDRAEGFTIHDAAGNRWIDFSSGLLVANTGHSRPEIVEAIVQQARRGPLHSYVFPNAPRVALARRLCELAAPPPRKVLLLSTGSEAVEAAIKVTRAAGRQIDSRKEVIISFTGSFHGRTLGAQMISGIDGLKDWIGHLDPAMIQLPFPDNFRYVQLGFDFFLNSLADAGVTADRVAGVIAEPYLGGGASFAPPAFMQALRDWCHQHQIILTLDEIQSGFGRTGRMWGFQHYDIIPDLICAGKGLSSSLPVAALIGRPELLDQFPQGTLVTTHTGSPVCAAAALASIDVIEKEGLIANAARMGDILHAELWKQLKPYDDRIGAIHGKGLVAGIHIVRDNMAPDRELAHAIVWHAVGRGLMLFAPVGLGSATIKIAPPLCISREAVVEGVGALAEAFADALNPSA